MTMDESVKQALLPVEDDYEAEKGPVATEQLTSNRITTWWNTEKFRGMVSSLPFCMAVGGGSYVTVRGEEEDGGEVEARHAGDERLLVVRGIAWCKTDKCKGTAYRLLKLLLVAVVFAAVVALVAYSVAEQAIVSSEVKRLGQQNSAFEQRLASLVNELEEVREAQSEHKSNVDFLSLETKSKLEELSDQQREAKAALDASSEATARQGILTRIYCCG